MEQWDVKWSQEYFLKELQSAWGLLSSAVGACSPFCRRVVSKSQSMNCKAARTLPRYLKNHNSQLKYPQVLVGATTNNPRESKRGHKHKDTFPFSFNISTARVMLKFWPVLLDQLESTANNIYPTMPPSTTNAIPCHCLMVCLCVCEPVVAEIVGSRSENLSLASNFSQIWLVDFTNGTSENFPDLYKLRICQLLLDRKTMCLLF